MCVVKYSIVYYFMLLPSWPGVEGSEIGQIFAVFNNYSLCGVRTAGDVTENGGLSGSFCACVPWSLNLV